MRKLLLYYIIAYGLLLCLIAWLTGCRTSGNCLQRTNITFDSLRAVALQDLVCGRSTVDYGHVKYDTLSSHNVTITTYEYDTVGRQNSVRVERWQEGSCLKAAAGRIDTTTQTQRNFAQRDAINVKVDTCKGETKIAPKSKNLTVNGLFIWIVIVAVLTFALFFLVKIERPKN